MSQQLNWVKLLDSHNIEYVDVGKSTSKGNIYVHCPFCGLADPSHHMGISLTGNAWGCWRDKRHRGRSPVKLLMALLRVSYAAARDLAGLDEGYVDPDGWDQLKHTLFKKQEGTKDVVVKDKLEMPSEFVEISDSRLRTARFFNYLVGRGFNTEHVNSLCREYKLRAAVSGKFKDRVIVPYLIGREVVSWTGRAIGESSLRYLDLSKDESTTPPKHTLFNLNATNRGGKVLLVHEGPFDALKVDFFGQHQYVSSVALSTNSITEQQTYILEEVAVNFERVLMVMDSANSVGVVDSLRLKEQLAQIPNIGFVPVPFGRKDGGDLTPDEVVRFASNLTEGRL